MHARADAAIDLFLTRNRWRCRRRFASFSCVHARARACDERVCVCVAVRVPVCVRVCRALAGDGHGGERPRRDAGDCDVGPGRARVDAVEGADGAAGQAGTVCRRVE
eukprot:2966302-Pleurochrysis_carterae.AAC.1